MESNPIGLLILLPLFLIFFCGIWMIVLTFISLAGGWSSLARAFPASDRMYEKCLKSFSFCSIRFNLLATYSGTMNIMLFEGGILIAPMFIFKFMHKPIFLPWDQIAGIEKSKVIFSTAYKLQVNMQEISIFGNAGEEVNAFYQHLLKK